MRNHISYARLSACIKKQLRIYLPVLLAVFLLCARGKETAARSANDTGTPEQPLDSLIRDQVTVNEDPLVITITPVPVATAEPVPAPSSEPTPTPTPEPTPSPSPSPKFAGKYTDEVIETENSYTSPDISYSWYSVTDKDSYSEIVTYFVVDIYVKDATLIKTGFASGSFTSMAYRSMQYVSEKVGAVIAISGDYARARDFGLVIRNGEVLRTKLDPKRDVGVLFKDGSFKTYLAREVPLDEILASDPWQSWCFGPALLDDRGHAKTNFNSDVRGINPRAVFGYYEPGHYCFVLVDGRQEKYSMGMRMSELSCLMESLGCSAAINLDGGLTAQLAWRGKNINHPLRYRELHDIIYIGESEYAGVPPEN